MKKEGKKAGRRHAGIGYVLAFVWISSMALGGFFMPVLIDTLPYFKIKAIQVEGNVAIPTYVFSKAVGELKNNWLFVSEKRLLTVLNALTGNSVEEVKIDRYFQTEGVILKIRVKERKPFLTVIEDKKILFFDDKGVPFLSQYYAPQKPYIYANQNLIKNYFSALKKLVDICKSSQVNSIYLTDMNTLIYTTNGSKILLPPLQQIDDVALKRFESIYNISMEAKEIDLTTEGMAIIKGGE